MLISSMVAKGQRCQRTYIHRYVRLLLLFIPISAAISGSHLKKAVQGRAGIFIFEHGGLGELVDKRRYGITLKGVIHHPDRVRLGVEDYGNDRPNTVITVNCGGHRSYL